MPTWSTDTSSGLLGKSGPSRYLSTVQSTDRRPQRKNCSRDSNGKSAFKKAFSNSFQLEVNQQLLTLMLAQRLQPGADSTNQLASLLNTQLTSQSVSWYIFKKYELNFKVINLFFRPRPNLSAANWELIKCFLLYQIVRPCLERAIVLLYNLRKNPNNLVMKAVRPSSLDLSSPFWRKCSLLLIKFWFQKYSSFLSKFITLPTPHCAFHLPLKCTKLFGVWSSSLLLSFFESSQAINSFIDP